MRWWRGRGILSTEIEDPKDSGMKTYKLPADSLLVCQGLPGEIIPCDQPEKVVIVPPKDPKPDLATKPKDVVGHCFGYVCPRKHVQNPFENATVDDYKKREACDKCGGVSQPAVVKRIAEARWEDRQVFYTWCKPAPDWGWTQWKPFSYRFQGLVWTRYEFVHYLESPKRRKK